MNVRLALSQFVSLLAFWLVLSGRFNPLMVGMGVVSAAAVTLVTHELTASAMRSRSDRLPARKLPLVAVRMVVFAPWLLWRVVVASVQVTALAVQRHPAIDPVTLEVPVAMKSPLARTVLANSISIVPGTITIEMRNDRFVVHALNRGQADDLLTGALQRRVAHVFCEDPQPRVDPATVRPHDPTWFAQLEDDR